MSRAWIDLPVSTFLGASPARIAAELAAAQMRRNLPGQAQQMLAWERTITAMQRALSRPGVRGWTVLLEYPLLRLDKRADVVLLTDRAIFVIEFKTGVEGNRAAAARQVEDYALDLWDFHGGSRKHAVVPVVVAASPTNRTQPPPLPLAAVWPVQHAKIEDLGDLLLDIVGRLHAGTPLDADWWRAQPYRPVPSIVEAARMAFARQAVPDVNATRADAKGLKQTTAAVLRHVGQARQRGEHRIVFVTGIPGAGKTRCGLAVAFEADDAARGSS